MISKKFLNILIVCFWTNTVYITTIYIYSFSELIIHSKVLMNNSNPVVIGIITLFDIPFLLLFFYSNYFFYKYDRYSKSGVYFLFFNIIYAHIYFYRVIWKRKRELENRIESEQVLGNSIFIETEEDDFDHKS